MMRADGIAPVRLQHAQQFGCRTRLSGGAQAGERIGAQHAIERRIGKGQLTQVAAHRVQVVTRAQLRLQGAQ